MLKRHDFLFWRSVVTHETFVHRCTKLRPQHTRTLRSVTAVSVNLHNCGDRQRSCPSSAVPRRFFAALCIGLNVRKSTQPLLTHRETGSHHPTRCYSRLWPNVRWLTLSPKAIIEASPLYIQPYLRLIRLDRPIGIRLQLHLVINISNCFD